MITLEEFQTKINYIFKNQSLLQNALVHRSYLSDKDKLPEVTEHNERLEFLGDAVLELVITEYLYQTYTDNEGYLTALRAALVNYKIIGTVGNIIGLDEMMLISSGERLELGKARLTIVADGMEAVLGAMYLDGGYIAAKDFISNFVVPNLSNIIMTESFKDPKTRLQEYMQQHFHKTPYYKTVNSEGKDHEKIFFVNVLMDDKMIAEGSGRSKQDAQTQSAISALVFLKDLNEAGEKVVIQDLKSNSAEVESDSFDPKLLS